MSVPPFGYDKIEIVGDKGFTLQPNENAKTIEIIYKWYIEGDGSTVIAKKLDSMKISPRHGGMWSKATITDILKNPVYMGMVRWGYKKEKKTYVDGVLKKTRTKNSDDYIFVKGIHPAIISEEDFNKAQIKRQQNTHQCTTPHNELKNPLAGLIYCQKCGGLMSRMGSNKKNKYDNIYCPNRYCDNVAAPVFMIEKAIISVLSDRLRDFKVEVDFTINNEREQAIKNSVLDDLSRSHNVIEKQISQTYDLLEQQLYTADLFKQRNQELQQRKEEIEKAIEKINSEEKSKVDQKYYVEEFIPQIKDVVSLYFNIPTVQGKNDVLKTILKRLYIIKKKPIQGGMSLMKTSK
ncbi:MAG: recombinase family protein [Eubacteriales bacterium]|nr:recombinase family protein [Eubacteriales bacterium]MDD4474229.1 recombinase family protein [Eubacteriales bacterium]